MGMELMDATANGRKLVSVASGVLKLRNDLKFSFEIVARKQG
jgi:hypothetical protein